MPGRYRHVNWFSRVVGLPHLRHLKAIGGLLRQRRYRRRLMRG